MGIPAHANWLVDEARWHVSAHGQIMCLDYHGDVGKEETGIIGWARQAGNPSRLHDMTLNDDEGS